MNRIKNIFIICVCSCFCIAIGQQILIITKTGQIYNKVSSDENIQKIKDAYKIEKENAGDEVNFSIPEDYEIKFTLHDIVKNRLEYERQYICNDDNDWKKRTECSVYTGIDNLEKFKTAKVNIEQMESNRNYAVISGTIVLVFLAYIIFDSKKVQKTKRKSKSNAKKKSKKTKK